MELISANTIGVGEYKMKQCFVILNYFSHQTMIPWGGRMAVRGSYSCTETFGVLYPLPQKSLGQGEDRKKLRQTP